MRQPWHGMLPGPGWTPRIPDHEVVRVIGEGSHGQVWLARSVLGAWRAVKVVRNEAFADVRPFDREFAGVQRFEPLSREDEGFVDVLHTGRNDAEGYFYYVMELADDASGRPADGIDPATYAPCTLGRMLSRSGRLDVERCVALGRRIASALGRLHRAGLIHRDVKPSNIVLVGGHPKLADIGLVAEQSEARSYVGTDGYIAPEGPNSAQADLYSLGMVLYEAGMGQRRQDFPRPCDAMDGGTDAGVLRELNAVLLRACAALPGQRYATADELASDLALVASGGSVRRRHRWRRWRRALAVAAVLGVVGLAAWGTWAWQRARWIESGRQARLDEQEQRVSQMHLASGLRSMHDGDDAMALLWLAQVVASKEARGHPVVAERVLAGQIRSRLPLLRTVLPVGGGLFSMAYSPDGSALVTSDDRGWAIAWDPRDGRVLHGPVRCGDRPVQVRMTGQGWVAWAAPRAEAPAFREASHATGTVRWIDLATGRETATAWEGIGWAVASPDQRWLATADSGFRVGLGRADGQGARVGMAGHAGSVEALAFNVDGSLLASGSDDGTVRVWRVPDGALAGEVIRAHGRVRAVAWGGDARSLATLSEDSSRRRSLEWWDVATGRRRLAVPVAAGGGSLLDHGVLNGDCVLLASRESQFAVLRATDGSPVVGDLSLRSGRWRSWAVGQEGRSLLVGNLNGDADLWSMEDGRPLAVVPRHPRAVRWVGFHPSDGSWFTAAEDGVVRVWERPGLGGWRAQRSGLGAWEPSTPKDDPWESRRAAWNARGDTLLAVVSGETMHAVVAMRASDASWATVLGGLAFAPRVTIAAAAEGDAWVIDGLASDDPGGRPDLLWIGRGPGGWTHRRLRHPAVVADMQLVRPDRLITIDESSVVRAWNPVEGRVEKEAGTPAAVPSSYVLSPDGRTVAAWDARRRRLAAWDWENPTPLLIDVPVEGSVGGFAFVGGSDVVAATAGLSPATAWDIRRGRSMDLPHEGLGGAKIHDWNPRTRRLLVYGAEGSASVLDLATRARRGLGGMEAARVFHRAVFSPNGEWVLTRDSSGPFRAYDAASALPVTPPVRHGAKVGWAGISASNVLVSLSEPDLVQRWVLEPCTDRAEALLREAEALSGRRVDAEGRETWLGADDLVQRVQAARPAISRR